MISVILIIVTQTLMSVNVYVQRHTGQPGSLPVAFSVFGVEISPGGDEREFYTVKYYGECKHREFVVAFRETEYGHINPL